MPVLIWKHGRTRNQVCQMMRDRLETAGISNKVVWTGDCFTSSVGWGTILNLDGEITDDLIILKKSSGALGSTVLAKSREAFQEMFPNGEQVIPSGSQPTMV